MCVGGHGTARLIWTRYECPGGTEPVLRVPIGDEAFQQAGSGLWRTQVVISFTAERRLDEHSPVIDLQAANS